MAAIEQLAAKGQGLGPGPGQGLCPPDLPGMLGRLVGRFLLSTESANDEINNDSNEGSPNQESHHDHGMDRGGVMNHMDDDNDDDDRGEEGEGGGDVGANHRVIVSSHPPLSPLRASDKAQGPGLEPGSNRSVFRPRPCWHAFSSGGLKLYLSTRWDPHLSHP